MQTIVDVIKEPYPLDSSKTLRGLFKLLTDKLTVDGDIYNSNGSLTRKYTSVNLGSLSWVYYGEYGGHKTFYSDSIKTAIMHASDYEIYGVCSKTYIAYPNAYNKGTGDLTLPDKAFRVKIDDGRIYFTDDNYTDASSFKTSLNGNYLVYQLATITSETANPFIENEKVGTEEFIDYGVSQNTRDVAIPVGTETDYYQGMELPPLPTASGNHSLQYNPASGFSWS